VLLCRASPHHLVAAPLLLDPPLFLSSILLVDFLLPLLLELSVCQLIGDLLLANQLAKCLTAVITVLLLLSPRHHWGCQDG
jgi:hypothetical protein